jgi:hypothetical protein
MLTATPMLAPIVLLVKSANLEIGLLKNISTVPFSKKAGINPAVANMEKSKMESCAPE